jgi:hypothetical protein
VVKEILDTHEHEELMASSQVFLDWEQKTIQKQEPESLVLRLLNRRLGEVSPDLKSQVQELSLTQIEALSEGLLDFSTLDDLVEWLRSQNTSKKNGNNKNCSLHVRMIVSHLF